VIKEKKQSYGMLMARKALLVRQWVC